MNLLQVIGIGAAVGLILSLVLGAYSKPTTDAFTRSIFGMKSSEFIGYIMVFTIITGVIVLSTFSILIRDLSFPVENPWNFTLETLLFAFLPASFIFMSAKLRGFEISSHTLLEFAVLALKFGLFHILLQFSGFYTSVFPAKQGEVVDFSKSSNVVANSM